MDHSPISNAEVVASEQLCDDIFRITLMAPHIAREARPGQFVMVQTAPGMDPLLRRPFSIHQVNAAGQLQILFKVVGRGTRLLAGMRPEDRLSVLGPLGRGFDLSGPEGGEGFCLVGGGMGIAPLLFLAQNLLLAGSPNRLLVLLGARTAAEVTGLEKDFTLPGVEVAIATDDGSAGHHGLVTDLMRPRLAAGSNWQVYTCGPYPMMRGVARICQAEGFRCQVSMETMMACGMGACLGCAISKPNDLNSYLHVCKDGPVFEMSEVVWR